MRRFSTAIVLVGLLVVACGGGSEGDGPGSVPAGAIDAERCSEVASAMAAAAAAVPQALTGTAQDLEQSVDQLEAFAEEAPEEIRADLQVVTEGYARVVQVLVDANFDPTSGVPPSAEVVQQLQQVSQELDEAEFRDAVDRVNTWFRDECGR